jgi:hypothetical protein
VAIETNLKQLFMNGMVVPSSINRRVADVPSRSAAPKELAAYSHASSKRSSTSIPHRHYCPVGVVDWCSWRKELEKFKPGVTRLNNVEMHVEGLVQNPIDERDMASNWYKVFSELGRACHTAGLVTYDLAPECVVRDDNSVKAKPDITIGIFESVKGKKGLVEEKFRAIFPSEAKAVDKWPALPANPSGSLTIPLPDVWKIEPQRAKYSHEQMAIVQLVTQMCAIKRSCGSLFNGFSAYFCKLDENGVLHAAGPFDMTSSIFFQTFVSFVKFSFAQDAWSEVPEVLKAAATGAQDDDMDRTGDGEDIGVEVPGPGLGREYDCENYQIMLNEGAEGRPQVWLRRIGVEAEKGETVAVKAVDHDMDHDGSLRSELVNEINVYQRLENSGTHDFIPEFVGSGKLPGGDRSAIVTKFAGGGIDMWKPKDKAEALDVQRKAQDALTSLHDHGFMHGDVALRNFVMDEDNRKVRVIDLGRSYEVNEVSKPEIEIEALKSEFRSSFPQFFDE